MGPVFDHRVYLSGETVVFWGSRDLRRVSGGGLCSIYVGFFCACYLHDSFISEDVSMQFLASWLRLYTRKLAERLQGGHDMHSLSSLGESLMASYFALKLRKWFLLPVLKVLPSASRGCKPEGLEHVFSCRSKSGTKRCLSSFSTCDTDLNPQAAGPKFVIRHQAHQPYEPWSKPLIKGMSTGYAGPQLKGYEAVCIEF